MIVVLCASFTAPVLARPHRRAPTQYILETGWTSSECFWYVHVIQYGNKPATLSLSVYSQEIGQDILNVEKVLTRHDSYRWGARHTTLAVTFDYNGSPERLYISFWATEKPSRSSGSKGDMVTAAGEATVRCLGSRIEGASATVVSWREPR